MATAVTSPQAFVTGASGFLGPHVVRALGDEGFQVFASATPLNDVAKLKSELSQRPWDLVVHLAGLSLPADCERSPALAYETNLGGTIEFAKTCADVGIQGLFVFFSTAYVYAPDLEGRLTESSTTKPSGVYGRSKLFAEQALRDIAPTVAFPVLALRLFNHSHKSQRPDFFLPAMYRTLNEARDTGRGLRVPVPMGNPNLRRDFSSLQDLRAVLGQIAKNRVAVARKIKAESRGFMVCNLCSGQERELGSLVHVLAKKMGLEAELQPQADRMRAGEPPVVCGDPTALRELLNFYPSPRSDEEFIDLFLEDQP